MARQALQAPVFPAGPESCMSAPGDDFVQMPVLSDYEN